MASEKEATTYSPLLTEEQHNSSPRSRPTMASFIFYKFIRTCVAEMLGTMTFVFVDVCSVSLDFASGKFAGFTHGFILFVNVAATATVR
jgi:hypothetical protein